MAFAKTVEMTSESPDSFDNAVSRGIERATETLDAVRGIWIKDQETVIKDEKIQSYRVHMRVTFGMG